MDTKTSPVVPIAAPITGREPPGDPGAPASALAQFYRAFNSRDLALMEANWDASPDVAMDNPLGGMADQCGGFVRAAGAGAGAETRGPNAATRLHTGSPAAASPVARKARHRQPP